MKWSATLLTASLSIALSPTGIAQDSTDEVIDLPTAPAASIRKPNVSFTAFEITGFERRTFTVKRVRGKILINGIAAARDIVEKALPVIPLIEHFDHVSFADSREFRQWARSLHGTRTYTYDNVFIRRSNGTTETTPLVLLQNEEREVANVQWEQWLARQQAIADNKKRESDARRAHQARYHALQLLVNQQAETAKRLAAIESNSSSLNDSWLVYLVPDHGSISGTSLSVGGAAVQFSNSVFLSQPQPGFTVRVNGSDSRIAANRALAQYPGYIIGGAARDGY